MESKREFNHEEENPLEKPEPEEEPTEDFDHKGEEPKEEAIAREVTSRSCAPTSAFDDRRKRSSVGYNP